MPALFLKQSSLSFPEIRRPWIFFYFIGSSFFTDLSTYTLLGGLIQLVASNGQDYADDSNVIFTLSFLLNFRPTSSTTDSIKQNCRIPTPYIPPKSCSLHKSSPEKVPSTQLLTPKSQQSSFTLFSLVSLSESVSPKQLYLRNQSEFNRLWPSLPQYP